jgi:hypothetical protein
VLGEALLERRPEAGRRERRRAEDALDLVVVGERPAICVGVGARERRDLLARALEVHPHREVAAVREGDVRERVGDEVLEAVVAQEAELVVEQQRVRLDERVAGRARVDLVAGQQQLLGGGAAAGDRPRVEHEALVAGLREIGGGDQAVVPSARDDHVGGPGHE